MVDIFFKKNKIELWANRIRDWRSKIVINWFIVRKFSKIANLCSSSPFFSIFLWWNRRHVDCRSISICFFVFSKMILFTYFVPTSAFLLPHKKNSKQPFNWLNESKDIVKIPTISPFQIPFILFPNSNYPFIIITKSFIYSIKLESS